ncbi:MAG: ABC transporter permease [Candidatus Heimdallarchaeota archaeon]
MGYFKYVIKRILISLVTIFGVIIITFFLSRMIPGDPVWRRLPSKASYEDYLEERARLGLDQPVIVQFFIYMGDLLTGNWGVSISTIIDYPISDLVSTHLPRTLEVTIISMLIAIYLGIRLGKSSAAHKNSMRDKIMRIFTYFFISIPGFVVVIFFMQMYLFTPIKIFPMFGIKNPKYPEPPFITGSRLLDCLLSKQIYLFVDYIWHLIIPVSAMVIIQMVAIIRHTRSNVLEVLQMDYIRTAEAKGCKRKKILKKHAIKNAIPPVITVSAMGFPVLLGGMIGIELIYNFPGLGFLFREAVEYLDYPLIIAIIFVLSISVIIINLIADLFVAALDPRIRLK